MSRRHVRLGAVPLALVLALTSCSLVGGGGERPTLAPHTAPLPTPAPQAPTGPTLVDAGAEPRAEHRLTLTPGTAVDLRVSSLLTVVQSQDGRADRTFAPPLIVQTLRLQVGATDDRGADLQITLLDLAVEVEDQDLAADLRSRWESAIGATGSAHLSDRGHLSAWKLDLPEDLDPDLASQLTGLSSQVASLMPALPSEPIGIGARWQSTGTINVGGSAVTQETTYTLTATLGSLLGYTSVTSATAESQPVTLGLPEGTSAQLTEAAFLGNGEGTLDLATLAQTATATLGGTQRLDLNAEGETQAVAQKLTVITAVASS